MIAAQYEIVLPTDYDMDVIRRRVRERGSALDDRAGLGLKAYLVRDVAAGAPVNAYAPFYLWRDPHALAHFHWGGGGFSGIVRDFGRPVVRTWVGGGFVRGDAFGQAPTHAVRRVCQVPPDVDPVVAAEALAQGVTTGAGVHSSAWAIDPATWQSVELTLLTAEPGQEHDDTDVVTYRVLHLSAPEAHLLG